LLATRLLTGPLEALDAHCDPGTSPSEVRVDGRSLKLAVSTWLNLQPTSNGLRPDTVAPFRAGIALVAEDSGATPPRITSDTVWVAWQTKVFSAELPRDRSGRPTNAVQGRLWKGPLWLLQADSVDVALQIRVDGKATCIRAPRSVLRHLE
jgi:hypothetical protein